MSSPTHPTVASQVAALAPPWETIKGSPIVKDSKVYSIGSGFSEDFSKLEESTKVDVVYRSSDVISLTFTILRRIPQFKGLSEDDLLCIAGAMEVHHGKTSGILVEKLALEEDTDDPQSFSESSVRPSEMFSSSGVNVPHGQRNPSQASTPYCVLAILKGKLLLELPSVNGKIHYPVLPYDLLGLPHHWSALPDSSRYIGTEQFLYLKIPVVPASRIHKVLVKCERMEIERRVNFLKNSLNIKVFEGESEEVLQSIAASLLELHLSNDQILIEEGADADSLYFIEEGILGVTRSIDKTGGATNPHQEGGGEQMHIATLGEGDLCGELALFSHNPDVRPGEDTQWSSDYWRDKLLSALENRNDTLDESQKNFVDMLTKGTDQSTAPPKKSNTMEINAPPEPRGVLQKGSLPRKATVFATSPSLVLRLGYDQCRKLITGTSLIRLQECAKGYLSYRDLYREYEKKYAWEKYKKGVVDDVMNKDRKH